MKFSQVSSDSRLKQNARIRNESGYQDDLKQRLKEIAAKKITKHRTRKKNDNPSMLLPSVSNIGAFAKLVAYKERADSSGGLEISKHPMWYPGADASMFSATHYDKRGRSWSRADAAYIMQPIIKGFLHRKNKKKDAEAALTVLKQIYAKKIQVWWRGISARTTRRRLELERILKATTFMQGLVRRTLMHLQYQMILQERIVAAQKIQFCFRKSRMLRLIPILRVKRRTDACILVQRRFREHQRWLKYVAEEQEKVYKRAKELRDKYLFAVRSREETDALRRNSAAIFVTTTDIFARKLAFSKQKTERARQVSSDGSFEQQKDNSTLKEMQEISKHDFWNLDAKLKDSHEVAMKLEECRQLRLCTLELSQQSGGLSEILKRWPYGLQGKHGLFHITALCIQGNEISGLPLDFYYLTSLTEVRANNNKIKSLLPEIKRLELLQLFLIHNNCLTSIPVELGSLWKLTQLSLAHNQLQILPGEIGFLTALVSLRLEGNPWQSPPLEIIKTLRPCEGRIETNRVMCYLRKYAGAINGCVELGGAGLLRIPECFGTLKLIRELLLQNNRISQLEDPLFELNNLLILKLDENRIERIPRGIRKLKQLKDLGLTRNRIDQGGLPIDSFVLMTTLETLSLLENPLSSPPVEILVQPASRILDYMRVIKNSQKGSLELTSFNLRSFPMVDSHAAIRKAIFNDNMFRDIPPSISGLSKLKELHISRNIISALPQAMISLTRLAILDVSSNNIAVIPDYMANFIQLVEVDFSQNQLKEIPPCIGSLTNLRRLSASHNQVRLISQKLSMLPLWELNLAYNCLNGLPEAFKNMKELRKLILEGNCMSCLPNSVINCVQLEILNLTRNPLIAMPSNFSGFGNIQLLQLSDCKLSSMPSLMSAGVNILTVELERNQMDTFPVGLCTLKAVQTLKFKENYVTAIPPHIGQLTSLTNLDISQNQICSIAFEIRHLSNLTSIDMSRNKIRALPPFPPYIGPVFGYMVSLRFIDLRHNQLRKLPADLCMLTNLSRLALDDNPWSDDKNLKRVIESSSSDLCGELVVHVIDGHEFARMDAGEGISDPYVVVELGKQKLKTQTKPGTLNPKWDEMLSFQLWGHSDEDLLKFSVWDWDMNGAHDMMGAFEMPISPQVLRNSTVDSQNPKWHKLQGQDALGRKARGKLQVGLKFLSMDGSLDSILRYLNVSKHSGMAPATEKVNRVYVNRGKATPKGQDIADIEQDEIRDVAELNRMDLAVKQVQDWLWRTGARKETWETLDLFYAPSGIVNCPWEAMQTRFEQQCDAMQEYLSQSDSTSTQVLGGRGRRTAKRAQAVWNDTDKRDTEHELLGLLKGEFETEY